jgi:hypothetical protein
MSSYSEDEKQIWKMNLGDVAKEKDNFINAYVNKWKAYMKQSMNGKVAY